MQAKQAAAGKTLIHPLGLVGPKKGAAIWFHPTNRAAAKTPDALRAVCDVRRLNAMACSAAAQLASVHSLV